MLHRLHRSTTMLALVAHAYNLKPVKLLARNAQHFYCCVTSEAQRKLAVEFSGLYLINSMSNLFMFILFPLVIIKFEN